MKEMPYTKNEHGQPIGDSVPNWKEPPNLSPTVLQGQHCILVPLEAETHAAELFKAFSEDRLGKNWTYLPYGPFEKFEDFRNWVSEQSHKSDPLFFSVVEAQSGLAVGVVSYMRINPSMGVVEIGHINFAPQLQRTTVATEALYLMLSHVFSLGYRRCEWKCNALNEASRRAALRLGFSYEGTFRQAAVIKGRNRDTAWFSMLDVEWPKIRRAFDAWLSPSNFDSNGQQKQRLSGLTDGSQSWVGKMGGRRVGG